MFAANLDANKQCLFATLLNVHAPFIFWFFSLSRAIIEIVCTHNSVTHVICRIECDLINVLMTNLLRISLYVFFLRSFFFLLRRQFFHWKIGVRVYMCMGGIIDMYGISFSFDLYSTHHEFLRLYIFFCKFFQFNFSHFDSHPIQYFMWPVFFPLSQLIYTQMCLFSYFAFRLFGPL